MSKKDANQLVNDLRKYFAENDPSYTLVKRGGHWHVLNAAGHSRAAFGTTPSDSRFRHNAIARLRQRGIVPHDWRG